MLSAILVDDEIHICHLLEKLINWDDYDIKILKKCTNGKEAYQAIIADAPDIVITDIRMPGYDGLKLVREIQKTDLNVTFLLISGHKDFEYAYNAIQYGVEHYMLKPIKKGELIKNLELIKYKLQEKKALSSIEKMTNFSQIKFLKDLVHHPEIISPYSEQGLLSEYLLDQKNPYRVLGLIKPDFKRIHRESQKQLILKKILSFLYDDNDFSYLNIIDYTFDEMVLILISFSNPVSQSNLESFFQKLNQKILNFCESTIGYEGGVLNYKDLKFQNVLRAVMYRMHYSKNRCFDFQKIKDHTVKNVDDTVQVSFRHLIELLNIREVEKWMEENSHWFQNPSIDPLSQYQTCENLIEDLVVLKISFSPSKDIREQLETSLQKSKIRFCISRNELFETFKSLLFEILNELIEMKNSESNHYIKSAKIIIEENFDKELTLEGIARSVSISPNYLSMLFKKEAGMNFNRYLTETRINKAKYYLTESRMNINEIALKVGFNDSRYFSKQFLKSIGLKPSEYRKLFC